MLWSWCRGLSADSSGPWWYLATKVKEIYVMSFDERSHYWIELVFSLSLASTYLMVCNILSSPQELPLPFKKLWSPPGTTCLGAFYSNFFCSQQNILPIFSALCQSCSLTTFFLLVLVTTTLCLWWSQVHILI